MAWVRLDDHFDEHPKLAQVGPLGVALWASGLAYSNRNATGGRIPWAVARGLVQWQFLGPREADGRRKVFRVTIGSGMVGEDVTAEFVIELLLEAGLWDEVDGGYQIHDYSDYQPSAEVVEERRQARVEAGRLGGLAKQANRVANAKQTASKPLANGLAKSWQKSAPYPVPVPEVVNQEINPPELPEVEGKGGSGGKPRTVSPTAAAAAAAAQARPVVSVTAFSEGAQAVLDEWRRAHGKRSPPKLNPTQAAQLEAAVADLGVALLQDSARWTAEVGAAEFHKCIRAARTKRQQDESGPSPPVRNGYRRDRGIGRQDPDKYSEASIRAMARRRPSLIVDESGFTPKEDEARP